MLTRLQKWSLLVGLAVMVLGASASAQRGCANGAPCVALGSDYLQTQPGSNFNFGPGIGVVNFMGLPIGPASTDTIFSEISRHLEDGVQSGSRKSGRRRSLFGLYRCRIGNKPGG